MVVTLVGSHRLLNLWLKLVIANRCELDLFQVLVRFEDLHLLIVLYDSDLSLAIEYLPHLLHVFSHEYVRPSFDLVLDVDLAVWQGRAIGHVAHNEDECGVGEGLLIE